VDFFQICTNELKGGGLEVYPDFVVGRSKDLMVRGHAFYAIWDEELGLWSTDEYDVQRLVDNELRKYAENVGATKVKYMASFNSNGWRNFKQFLAQVSDNSHQLDCELAFSNTVTTKKDYRSRRLPYSLEKGSHIAWDELVKVLYPKEERAKIEWSIGAIVSGDAKNIQKFSVLYGPAGTGKSTILNIVQMLFAGYTTTFEAKALGSQNGSFATEVFRHNPLVAIQHDGDLSRIEDNTRLNSIISHEEMTMNEKYKPSYTSRANAYLYMGTNQPVRISDAKSGLLRRLIDITPTGNRLSSQKYEALMYQVQFELGAIAHHCLEVYRKMGKNYYNAYRPLGMQFKTDVFFNFVESVFDVFKQQDGVTLRQAYALYKEYCGSTGIDRPLPQYKVREELRNYFGEFHDRLVVNEESLRNVFAGFNTELFTRKDVVKEEPTFGLTFDCETSYLDEYFADQPAQYAKEDGTPSKRWDDVTTKLRDLDTSRLHYVKVPESHVVIDFDIKDNDGRKCLARNIEAASSWPITYAEVSRSGGGIHLHYNYCGENASRLAQVFSEGIEVKRYTGNGSLRRLRNRTSGYSAISPIRDGLPLKEKQAVLSDETMRSERSIRDLIARNLRKEIHPGTKPSVDFIAKILDDAYKSGLPYDVTDMRPAIVAFANNSSNQALSCIKTVGKMQFKSSDMLPQPAEKPVDGLLVFFDVEVYPNLFVVCWKYQGAPNTVRMVNPTAQEVEALFGMKLVGFNNRRYDNHILYASAMGYTNKQLYALSQKIIDGNVGSMFGEAYNLSYADIFDFSSKKQSLKKFEIELGIHHVEMDIPWDKPVEEKDIPRVVEYCVNDVVATEAVFESRSQDFVARQILADLSGLTVNDTTQKHTARIIFGTDRNPQSSFVYTRLNEKFAEYTYERGKSTYRGEVVGEGGYVYAEPGMYDNVALLDVASMHPTSIRELNLFGSDYTRNFGELVDARLAIKHRDFESAKNLLGGKLGKYLVDSDADADALAYALKIVINIVYGLTSAKFDNPFRDVRNVDNIVAKRGALFMIDLKNAVQAHGHQVVHIKTDSIKIPNATPEIIKFVFEFGKYYGYTFEHEGTYDKFCLVNDAVYIARHGNKWEAVGAQFQHPYVFKSLFGDGSQSIAFEDMCETKSVVQGALYLDTNYDRNMVEHAGIDDMRFVGRVGLFTPVHEGYGGGILYRVKDGKTYAVTGTKGYLWVESEVAKTLPSDAIDMAYYERLASEARKTIEQYGDFCSFVGDEIWSG
jgi:hypothetical protein